MASSVAFPVEQHASTSSHRLPDPHPLPSHLPFRRISLPTAPHVPENRHSIVSITSFESTPEETQPSPPSPMKGITNNQKTPAHAHGHQRPASRARNGRKNRRSATNNAVNERRRKVVSEIFETERAYVNGLDLIYTKFLMPLISALDTPQPLLGRSELTSIFSNFIDIWNLHRSFLTSLTNLLSDPSDPPPLSPVLKSHFPYLSLYSPFVTAFPTVLTSLSDLMAASPAFSKFIHTQEADPQCGKLGLKDWLLTIVQRCPRYLLLLKDLIDCTDPSDPEHGSLTAVHTLLSKITQSLNLSLHTHSQTLGLLALQRATPNLPFQLITPGRSLVRRGPLLQGQVEHSASDACEFLLFSDCLVWLARADERKDWGVVTEHRLRSPKLYRGRSKSETELPVGLKMERSATAEERWTFKGRVELVDLEVVSSPAGHDNSERTRFDVLSPEVSFAVYAASEEERVEWTTAIRNAKSSLLMSLNMMHPNSTLTSSEATTHLRRTLQALPHAPDDSSNPRRGRVDHFLPAVWVPDSKTDSCMRCAARFSWRRRRHHCRLCGRCICADCSGKTFFISDANTKDTKSARACNACYDTVFPLLTSQSTASTSSSRRQGDSQNSYSSTLGTLSQLPSWQSMPSFGPPNVSGPGWTSSSLFKAPPSAFHEPRRRMGSRPRSQPVMNLNLSRMTSATASSASVNLNLGSTVEVNNQTMLLDRNAAPAIEDGRDESGESESSRPDPKRFSLPAVALHTAPVTAPPNSTSEGRNKRFSFLLGGRGMMHKRELQQQIDHEHAGQHEGVAAEKLSEILGRHGGKQL